MINTIRTIVSLFLLISCFWNIISNTYYIHSHIIEGKIVQHSHPFSKDKKHNHTGSDIAFIKLIESNYRFFLIIQIFLLLIYICHKFLYVTKNTVFVYYKPEYNSNLIRAPSVI